MSKQCVLDSTMYELVQTLSGHSDSVSAVAVSADGRKVVSGSDDETVKIWDAESGAELRTLNGHSDSVNTVAVSTDGTKVVSGSHDKTVKIWDAESGAELRTLSGHSDSVNTVAVSTPINNNFCQLVSGDGRKVVSGSDDGTVKIWDMESGAELHNLSGHSDASLRAVVSADGRKVVSSNVETMKIWDTESGAELCTLFGHSSYVTTVAASADGTKVVSGSDDGTVKIWDAESGAELCTLSPCGWVRGHCGHCGWTHSHTLSGHSRSVRAVAMSADGKTAVSGSDDETVKVWKMILFVPTKRVHELLMKTILNEDVIKHIMKFAVATGQELKRKQQKTIT